METKKSNSVYSFLWKIFLLALPFLFLTVFYLVTDPFKIIYKSVSFENYYDHQPYELNREYISTEMLQANKDKYHYDSFIMGSCESYVFHAEDWKKYIHTTGDVFHYPAASEILYGVYSKIKYLDKEQIPLKNCLLVMDISTFKGTEPRFDYIHSPHPDVSGENKLSYQLSMFKNYFSNFFCLQYADYKLTGKIKWYMKNNFAILPGQVRVTEQNNEYFYKKYDDALIADSIAYYKDKSRDFYFRDTVTKRKLLIPVIKEKQQQFLKEIKAVFDKNHTCYKIVLSPMYDQLYFNTEDIETLKNIFGAANVYDYSGVNAYTNDIHNYYDNFHYRPILARKLLKEIYSR
ncbi:MAG: hypothetical protein JWP12_1183 [Bacteroidetes bacterium]|nr:hypothetical protein [Bacteroidota bacterium]